MNLTVGPYTFEVRVWRVRITCGGRYVATLNAGARAVHALMQECALLREALSRANASANSRFNAELEIRTRTYSLQEDCNALEVELADARLDLEHARAELAALRPRRPL